MKASKLLFIIAAVSIVIFFVGELLGQYQNHLNKQKEVQQQQTVLNTSSMKYSYMKEGSITYIAEVSYLGEHHVIGGGYHRYFLKDGAVYGKIGAIEEIAISADNKINTGGGSEGLKKEEEQKEQEEKKEQKLVLDFFRKKLNKWSILYYFYNPYYYKEDGSIDCIVKRNFLVKDSLIVCGYDDYFIKDGALYRRIGLTEEVVISADGKINTDGGADGSELENQLSLLRSEWEKNKEITRIKEDQAQQTVLNFLGDSYRYEKIDSVTYLVKTIYSGEQQRVGGGYYHYFLKDGAVYGKIGATEEIVISADGKISTGGGIEKLRREDQLHLKDVLDYLNSKLEKNKP